MSLYEKGKEEKKDSRTKVTIGLLVPIFIAVTSLLSNSGNVPWWWFYFSLVFLIALIPFVILFEPSSERLRVYKLERKRDAISRKYFSEFRNLVNRSETFNSPINRIRANVRSHYRTLLRGSLSNHVMQSYPLSEIQAIYYYINKELDESDKSFRDLYLIVKHFESVLNIYKRNLSLLETIVHHIMIETEKPIAKGIEAEFEEFREKYNYFLNELKKFFHKINEEIEETELPEFAIDEHLKKW